MTRSLRYCLLFALFLGTGAHGEARPVVIELFTSQGCSSCPPADAYLGELARNPGVVALAYHVDYWDSLGWSDRFALPAAKQRQLDYARRLGLASVFTPQVIVDGQTSLVGSNRSRVAAAIKADRSGIPLRAVVRGDTLHVELAARRGITALEIFSVAYEHRAVTRVTNGENSGRNLVEFNIVRACKALGTWDGSARAYVQNIATLPAGAGSIAVLIQEPDTGRILGAGVVQLSAAGAR